MNKRMTLDDAKKLLNSDPKIKNEFIRLYDLYKDINSRRATDDELSRSIGDIRRLIGDSFYSVPINDLYKYIKNEMTNFSDRLMKCFDSVYNEQRYLDKAYDIISQIVKQLKKDYAKLGLEIKSNNLSKHTGSINIGKHHVYTKSDPRHGSITYYGTDLIVSIEYTIHFDDNIVFDIYRVDKKPVKNLGNVSIPFPKSGHVEPYWYGKLRDLVDKALS